jgi:(S)-3,5-dihydroxyphenylglycine transaminase
MFLGLLAVLVIASTLLASLSSYGHRPLPLIVAIEVLVAVVNAAMFLGGVVGGKLLRHGFSMAAANERETAVYLANIQRLLGGLSRRFPGGDVTWNCPSGGFFVVVTLPFAADDRLVERSAREHRVLWTPMSHFYSGGAGLCQVRLACSQLTPEMIETGLDRFAAFVAGQSRVAAGDGKLARAVHVHERHRTGQYTGSL